MTSITQKRLAKLKNARQLIERLENKDDEIDPKRNQELNAARRDLKQAGADVNYSSFDRYLEKSLGLVAGIAIAEGYDDIADDACDLAGVDMAEEE